MRKWRNDFQKSEESYYDLIDDFGLIESSFAQQYGIRLRNEIHDMKWGEFVSLLSGLNGNTPLGNVVRIRSEKDPEVIRRFNDSEKKIRSEWLSKNVKVVSQEEYKQAMESFKNMFKSLANQEDEK